MVTGTFHDGRATAHAAARQSDPPVTTELPIKPPTNEIASTTELNGPSCRRTRGQYAADSTERGSSSEWLLRRLGQILQVVLYPHVIPLCFFVPSSGGLIPVCQTCTRSKMRDQPISRKRGFLREIMLLLRPFWPITVTSTLIGTLGGLATAWLLANINEALHEPEGFTSHLALQFLGLCLLSIAGSTIAGVGNSVAGQKIIAHLRRDVAARVLATPIDALERHKPHRLLAILNGDIATVSAFTFNFSGYAVSFATVMASLLYLLFLSPVAFLIVVASFTTGTLLTLWRRRTWRQDYREVRATEDTLQKQYRTITEGARELQLNHDRRIHVHETLLTGAADRIADLKIVAMRRFWIFDSVSQAIFFLTVAVLLATRNWTGLSSAAVSGAVLVLLYVRGPLEQTLQAIPAMTSAEVSMQRVAELTNELPSTAGADTVPVAPPFDSAITLKDASYTFQAVDHAGQATSGFTLGPLSLTVRRGEILFIVGENGSGKTTLVKLLLGLYTPSSGSLYLDGHLVTADNVCNYRQLFSSVFADYFLFEDLIEPSEQDLVIAQRWIDRLEIGHKVAIVDNRFTTTDLSTGQRKRLALVLAFLDRRPIMMLDEWAADQDPTFRRIFYTELLPELKAQGRTLIVVSHDDRYFDSADAIIHMKGGQIVDQLDIATPEKAAS
ncbi:cyclic peptide export ABC transporter [Gluconobacter potus]|uniref:cyclic peptide export ABC transporter n=1 Tax=Gluconobacter potus TaxID=2724927 RepID=UPI0039EC6718